MKNKLNFNLSTYTWFLKKFKECGFGFQLISEMKHRNDENVVFLRHDVDLHISLVRELAQLESSMNISATYYVPLTLHFNVLFPENKKIINDLLKLGHKIGLHYDLETYPCDCYKARKHLDWEVNILSDILGQSVDTIAMHQPHKGLPDPFQCIDKYVNPHDPRYQNELIYISDSCRAWRDEMILSFFCDNPPSRLLLTTHPELWLDGKINDRMDYLNEVLIKKGTSQHKDYFNKNIREIWLSHPAPKLHDERENTNIISFH